jgi:hypothetical protein
MAGTHFRSGIVPSSDVSDFTVFPTGDCPATASTMGTDVTPTITITYLARVIIPVNALLTGIGVLNGSAVAGNLAVALYSAKTGAVIASSASTAQAGIAAYQKIPFTAPVTVKGPGMYFIGLQCSSASARFRAHAVGVFTTGSKTGETFGTFTTLTVPSGFTADVGPIASTY